MQIDGDGEIAGSDDEMRLSNGAVPFERHASEIEAEDDEEDFELVGDAPDFDEDSPSLDAHPLYSQDDEPHNGKVEKKKKHKPGLCGFIINTFPRSNGSNLGPIVDQLGDGPVIDWQHLHPAPANSNSIPDRWPLREECKSGRLDENTCQAIEYIAEVWNRVTQEAEPLFSPGYDFGGSVGDKVTTPDLTALRGQEKFVHSQWLWAIVDKNTFDWSNERSRLTLVLGALRDRCEMRDLAPDVRNKEHRARIGRARLIEALPIVAEEIRLLDFAEAA